MGAADLLALTWEEAPVDSEHAYVQYAFGGIHHGNGRGYVSEIEEHIPDPALDRLPSTTKVESVDAIIAIERSKTLTADGWQSGRNHVVLGPVANRLSKFGAEDVHPKAAADAASQLISKGVVSPAASLFSSSPEAAEAQAEAAAEPPTDADAADTADGPRAIDLTTTPLGKAQLADIQSVSKHRFNGVTVAFGGWCSPNTRSPDRPHSAATKARVDLMPDEEIQALLEREPDGEVVKYLDVPDPLYDRIMEWRPQLEDYEPCAAIFQKNLLDYHRDGDWHLEADCTGIPIPHTFVFAAFGMAPRTGWNRGLTAAMLLEIYRRTIDGRFRWSGWNKKEGKARVVAGHGIPNDIIALAKHSLFSPAMEDSWTYLINGNDAGNRHFTGALRDRRRDELEDSDDPAVDPPEVAKEMQEYLNGLDHQFFGNGRYGKLRPEQLAEASEAASAFREERRRDQANRKLVQMRTHPQPLYKFCDRFPRLKADPYNQLMNLAAELRHPLYGERDYEVDLSKAHFASYVPVVRREGIEVPILEKYLAANLRDDADLLERGDLWWDLASMVDEDAFSDRAALRTAVKRAYSSVYGSGVGNMLFRILELYATLTGHWPPEGTEPLKAILDHPLMEELFETRDKLEAVITDRGGLEDANGRFIPLSAWDETKKRKNRWRGVMAYVNASYEQEVMYPIFREAKAEMERDGKTRFKVWLYQGDGVSINVHRDYAHEPQIARLQKAVKERANELDVPTRLEVDWPE